jgi:quercetin dioxygenase-like cupin family protein
MSATETTAKTKESHIILGETLTPLLTNAMGSAIEVFDTRGIPGGGPPPHKHKWEEIYVVIAGEMEVMVDGKTHRLKAGEFAHVPADTPHAYKTLDETHFLTIVSKGNAAKFFKDVGDNVAMNPPDFAGIVSTGARHGVHFL